MPASAHRRGSTRARLRLSPLAGILPAAFLAVFFAWPVTALIARGFADQQGFTASGVVAVFNSGRTWRVLGQTLLQAAVGTVISLLLGIPGAFVLYCRRFPGRRAVRALVSIPFVLPSVVVGVAFQALINQTGPLGVLKLHESFASIVAALVFFNYAVVVRTVGTLWARLDPNATDTARSLGATRARAFRTVTLPALAPAIASAAALTFLYCASAFGIVLILAPSGYGTVETEIYYQTTQLLNLPVAAALSILQLAIVAVSLMVSNFTQARNERALRLRSSDKHSPLRFEDWPTVALTAIVILGLLATPMANLLLRSFITKSGLGVTNYSLLATTAQGMTASVWQAVLNSLATATVATAITVTLGLQVSYLLSRRPRSGMGQRLLRLADSIFMLPLGVSAVTVGFGFLITLNRPPLDLRTSWALIPLAQVMVSLPIVIRTLLPTWRAISPRMRESAASLGAGPTRVLATVDLPYLTRGIGLGLGLAFATSLGEFGATSFLARPDRPTLPVVIFRLIGHPGANNFGMAMAACVVLALLTGVVMALAELIGPRHSSLP
jgi:thiamine transport system permease protein